MMLRALFASALILAAAMLVAPAAAQNEGMGVLSPRGGPRMARVKTGARLDCSKPERLDAIDRAVCANPALRAKDTRLAREFASLKRLAGDARAAALEAEHTDWL